MIYMMVNKIRKTMILLKKFISAYDLETCVDELPRIEYTEEEDAGSYHDVCTPSHPELRMMEWILTWGYFNDEIFGEYHQDE